MTVHEKVLEILAGAYKIDVSALDPKTNFYHDLDDSLQLVEAAMDCEEKLDIEIDEEDMLGVETVGQFTSMVGRKLRSKPQLPDGLTF